MTRQVIRLTDSYDSLADAAAIDDYATLLCILLAQPDADSAIDQMHRIAWLIVDHARAIQIREETKAKKRA